MRNYFIRYDPEAKVNLNYILMLYGIAEHNSYSKRYDCIPYTTKKELAAKLKDVYGDKAMSYSTLWRLLYTIEYTKYIEDQGNMLYLHNNFANRANTEKQPFIILTDKEADFLIDKGDRLLTSYYCYIKYYCKLAEYAGRTQDFTAKQFLQAVGLSTNNHNNLSKISSYNTLLTNEGLIKITKFRDQLGRERNVYSLP